MALLSKIPHLCLSILLLSGPAGLHADNPLGHVKSDDYDGYLHPSAVAASGSSKDAEEPEWAKYTLDQIKDHLNCHEMLSTERPVHDQQTWMYLRQIYHDIVGPERSTIGPPNRPYNGFAVPFRIDQSPGKGRGLFAAKDIKKGDLVWSAIRTAEFDDAATYRKFLMSLPADLACDVILWAYVEDTSDDDDDEEEEEEDSCGSDDDEEKETLKIMVDLDEGSFCNNGGQRERNLDWSDEEAKLYPDGFDLRVFSTRDIKAGEELLCNYHGFFVNGGWEKVGL